MAQRSPAWLTVLSLGFLALWLALASVPFLWTLWGSFKVEADFFQGRTGEMPSTAPERWLKPEGGLPAAVMKAHGSRRNSGKRP